MRERVGILAACSEPASEDHHRGGGVLLSALRYADAVGLQDASLDQQPGVGRRIETNGAATRVSDVASHDAVFDDHVDQPSQNSNRAATTSHDATPLCVDKAHCCAVRRQRALAPVDRPATNTAATRVDAATILEPGALHQHVSDEVGKD